MKKVLLLSLLLFFFNSEIQSANYFWIGGSGNWSQISHWATSSGGSTLHSSVPGTNDDVIFDANSFSANGQAVTTNVAVNVKSMDWSAISFLVSFNGTFNPTIYGDLLLSANLSWNTGSYIYLKGIGTHDLDPAGVIFDHYLYFQDTGSYNLQDSLVTDLYIYIQNRTFNTNDYKISTRTLYVNGSGQQTVNLGTSKLYGTNSTYAVFSFSNANLTLDANEAYFYLTGSGGSFSCNSTQDFNYIEYLSTNTTGSGDISIANNSHIDTLLSNNLANTLDIKNSINISYLLVKNKIWFRGDDSIHRAEIWGDIYCLYGSDLIFDSLFLTNNSNGQLYELSYTGSLRVNDSLYIEPGNCSNPVILTSSYDLSDASLYVNSGTVNLDYAYIYSINASGSATFNGTNIIDTSSLTGWNITLLNNSDFYWVGGSGVWDDATNWSLSSGGTPISSSGCYPRYNDDVIFDQNSFSAVNQVVEINSPEFCHSMSWTNTSYEPTLKQNYPGYLVMYGNLATHDSMSWIGSNSSTKLYFRSDSQQQIDFGGLVMNQRMAFDGAGTYELLDSIHNFNVIEVNKGTFNTNDHYIYCYGFGTINNNAATLNMGQSEIDIQYYTSYPRSLDLYSSNLTLDFDSAIVNIKGGGSPEVRSNSHIDIKKLTSQNGINLNLIDACSVDTLISNGSFLTLNDALDIGFMYSIGEVTVLDAVLVNKAEIYDDFTVNFVGTSVFDTLLLYDNNEARTYTFKSGSTFKIQDSVLFPTGNCTNTHTIKSSSNAGTSASRATIEKPTGQFYANYYNVNSINGTGGANFTIDNVVSKDGNNNGLTLNDLGPFNLYWVGGTGYWDSASSWSLTSGGAPQSSAGCIPDQNINAIFDANSFSANGQRVYLTSGRSCRNHIWDGVTNNPILKDTLSYSNLLVYGNLQLDSNMVLDLFFGIELRGIDTFTVKLEGQRMNRLWINCTGYYSLLDSLNVKDVIEHFQGGLGTNGNKVRTGMYSSAATTLYARLDLGTSLFICDSTRTTAGFYAFDSRKSNMDVDADSAVIFLSGNNNLYASFRCTSADTFRKVIHNAGAYYFSLSTNGYIDSVIFNGSTYSRLSSNINYNYVESHALLELPVNANVIINKLVSYDDLKVLYNYTIDTLLLYSNNGNRTYTINAGRTLRVRDSLLVTDGDCINKHRFTSSTIGSVSYLKVDTGYVPIDHYSIYSVYARGEANFSASNIYETDGRDSGWNIQFASIDTLYWIGGTGGWKDVSNWSLSTGGSPLGSSDCLPNGRTTVIFDQNSFSSSSQTVTLDTVATCYSFLTAGATGGPTLTGSEDLFIYGDFILTDSLIFDLDGNLHFNASDSVEIDFAGNTQPYGSNKYLYVDGDGVFELNSDLQTDGNISIRRGTLNTNNYKIHGRVLLIEGNESLTLNLGTSIIETDLNTASSYGSFSIDHTALTLDADETTIKLIGGTHNSLSCDVPNNDLVFNRIETYGQYGSVSLDNAIVDSVLFYGTGPSYYYSSDTANYVFANNDLQIRSSLYAKEVMVWEDFSTTYNANFHLLHTTVYGNLYLGSDATFDTLILLNEGPSTLHRFSINDTCFINDSLYINSNGCYKTTLQSTNTTSTAYVKMPASSGFFGQYLEVKSLTAFGGGDFNVGINSSDLGGNSGWDFTGSSYLLQLKFQYVCIDTPGVSTVQAVPDGYPVDFWWRETISPFDTFNTGIDTIMATSPGDWIFVIQYGTNCIVEDSVFVRVAASANGTAQTFENNAGDNSWYNCSNWDLGLIPDSLSDATIAANDTVIIQPGQNAYCKNLTNNGFIQLNGGNLYVYGSVNMNGEVIHDHGDFYITGSGTDSILSSSRAVFDSLIIDKDGYVNISSLTTINGFLELIDGYIQTTSVDSLIFEDGASSGGGNDESFILGPVYKRGENLFTFPIGDSNVLAQLGISAPTTSGSNLFKAEYFFQPHNDIVNIQSPIVKISSIEYWTLDRISGNGAVRVKLYYNDSARSYIPNAQYVNVGRYNGSIWTDAGQNNYSQGNGAGYVESDPVSTFSPFTFGAINGVNPVPVNFLNVVASWKASDALIEWSTASEINNHRFEVERSVNGTVFEPIGTVPSKNGFSQEILHYELTDFNVQSLSTSTIYYRIKQIDFDGSSEHSKTVRLINKPTVGLFPNPTRGIVNIIGLKQPTTITLSDIHGKQIIRTVEFNSDLTLDISGLKDGCYIIRVDDGHTSSSHRITLLK